MIEPNSLAARDRLRPRLLGPKGLYCLTPSFTPVTTLPSTWKTTGLLDRQTTRTEDRRRRMDPIGKWGGWEYCQNTNYARVNIEAKTNSGAPIH
jgi:hypothetical protein